MKLPLRILHLEDSPQDAELIHAAIEAEGIDAQITRVERRADFESELEKGEHDLVLADYSLPAFDGLTALSILRNRRPDIPFILLSGTVGEDLAVEALKRGATDYLLKQRLARLAPAIRRAVHESEQRAGHARVQKKLDCQHVITRILAESPALKDAGTSILQMIGESLLWDAGELWVPDHAQKQLQCLGFWNSGKANMDPFAAVTMRTNFMKGQGLPGNVWDRKEMVWVPDYAVSNFSRSPEAALAGLQSAAAFPLILQDRILGVICFFSREMRPFDNDLSELMISIAAQIAQFIERKRSEELREELAGQLRNAEIKYRSLVESLPAIVYRAELGTTGRWFYVSPQVETLLGFSPQEWMENPGLWFQQLHPLDRERVREKEAEIQNTNEPFLLEYRICTRQGKIVWFRDEAVVMKSNGIHGSYLQGFLTNITDLKSAEEARGNLEDQLRQSQKMEVLGQAVGGVAHDFNNILMALSGYSELLAMKINPDDLLFQDVAEIRKAIDQGASLTRQLLAFSRNQVLELKSVDLNSVVRGIENMLKQLIREDINLSIETDPDLGMVKADAGQVEQVIVNLVVNARDAMPQGGELTMVTRNVDLDEDYAFYKTDLVPGPFVMLAVGDTGNGMDEQTKSRIFEPFFTTKEKGKGTGLGLSMVYGIVRQSGGHIYVYSERGFGTVLKIYFPRLDQDAKRTAPNIVLKHVVAGSETILIVDDNESVRKSISTLLEMNGYNVIQAAGGPQALEICGKLRSGVQLLITDLVMPQMGGRELARQMCANIPELKILYMTGFTEGTARQQFDLDQNDALLQKPVPMKNLLIKIRQLLK